MKYNFKGLLAEKYLRLGIKTFSDNSSLSVKVEQWSQFDKLLFLTGLTWTAVNFSVIQTLKGSIKKGSIIICP